MAFLQVSFLSRVLGVNTTVNVILPEFTPEEHRRTNRRQPFFQTLYLLHGYSGDCTDWVRFSSVERYAQKHRLAVIMPSAGKSFYCNTACGERYWDYIVEELPLVARSYFPLSTEREDNFVAGLSMGGYGALKMALSYPERFCAAISFSGVVDIPGFVQRCSENPHIIPDCEAPNFRSIFGDAQDAAQEENDLANLVHNHKSDLPRLKMYCGEEDFMLQDNMCFQKFLQDSGIDCDLSIGSGGHEWSFWDHSLEQALEWAPLKRTILY